jgi:hypothetical protein
MREIYSMIFLVSKTIIQSQDIQNKLMKSIFRAIAYGSNEAKIFIPYILQLSALKSNKMTNVLNLVPEWMFIPYISQMLSSYDFEGESYLDVLLYKLAVKYPNGECFDEVKVALRLYDVLLLQRSTFHLKSRTITSNLLCIEPI